MAAYIKEITLEPKLTFGYLGDGSSTTIVIQHDRQTYDVDFRLYESGTRRPVECDWRPTAVDAVTVTFDVAPASLSYRWMLLG